ncbi:MAG: serine/threonine-protein kinase, partial [Deltaproteobacteria bacterium]
MSKSVWFCPECQSEGSDSGLEFCASDGARLRPIASRGAEWVGRVLADKYRIVRFIDSGGTAEVFEAERLSSGKRVAVKLLHAAFAGTPLAVDRFLQEARLVSRIAHPNVVEIFDFGTLPGAVQYMAMELLAGRSLASELARRPLPLSAALNFALQACEGLAAAHERGVIHCDVKPANLFLLEVPGGGDRVVKILDLGIGRMQAHGPESGFADSGLVAGTPEYMSPEQASALPMGPATDIYAMGVVLWEMLLGTVPFEASTYSEVLSKQVYENPVWPVDLAAARVVPLAAGPIVLRALAKKPRDRQASMLDLQREVASLASIERTRQRETNRPKAIDVTPPDAPPRASRPPPSLSESSSRVRR